MLSFYQNHPEQNYSVKTGNQVVIICEKNLVKMMDTLKITLSDNFKLNACLYS